jgi:hypothetical protein
MAFEELKAKQSVMWGNGPYERVSEHLTVAHDHLFRALPPSRASAGSTSPPARARSPVPLPARERR